MFAKCVTFRKLQQPLKNALYSFRATRTLFHPHQFKPLLKFLDSPRHRLLIADEVGLGKTIEAGYILRELKARGPLRRVLVVCPSALCRKWHQQHSGDWAACFAAISLQRQMASCIPAFLRHCFDPAQLCFLAAAICG